MQIISLKNLEGLCLHPNITLNYALIFHMDNAKIRNGIHMLFVFYPILVLFLDENKCVVDKVILPPFIHFIPQNQNANIL
jgi:uncharacterized membrane protein (UPF0127 family)